MKFYDPMNHPEDPDVLLSREDDVDVSAQDEVLGQAPGPSGTLPDLQVNEAEPQNSAFTLAQHHWQDPRVNMDIPRHPFIGLPLVNQLWLEQKEYPPLLAFPDFV
jgi:hypothetical protein